MSSKASLLLKTAIKKDAMNKEKLVTPTNGHKLNGFSIEDIGDDHLFTSLETPMKKDAFKISDEEKNGPNAAHTWGKTEFSGAHVYKVSLDKGFELVAKDEYLESNAVTAIQAPKGYGEKEITEVLRIMYNKHAVEAAAIPGYPDMGWRLCATGGIQPQHALSASIAFLQSAEEAGLPIDCDKGIFAATKTYAEVLRYHRPLPGIDMYGR